MDDSRIARRDFFYVGGEYAGPPGESVMHGQIYVEKLTPRDPRRPYPLVMIHGAGQTATNWLGTPDGRPGWAEYFAGEGYTVYLVDQPARGRSAATITSPRLMPAWSSIRTSLNLRITHTFRSHPVRTQKRTLTCNPRDLTEYCKLRLVRAILPTDAPVIRILKWALSVSHGWRQR